MKDLIKKIEAAPNYISETLSGEVDRLFRLRDKAIISTGWIWFKRAGEILSVKRKDVALTEKEIDQKAEQELEKINSFAFSGLNQESAATWLIIKALAKGQKSWSELENKVNLGPSTLSRKLKKMQKQKFVKRKIIPSFPPRTAYELDKVTYPELVDDLVWLTKKLERTEQWTINDLAQNLITQKTKKTKQFLKEHGEPVEEYENTNFNTAEEALYYLLMDFNRNVYSLIRLMLSFSELKSHSLWSTYFAMIMMQKITAIVKNLSVTPEMKKEAILIIEREYDEKYKDLKALVNEKKFAKIFRQIDSQSTQVFKASKETESFLSDS